MSGSIWLNDDFRWSDTSGPNSGMPRPIPSGAVGGDPDWGSGGVIFSAHSGSGDVQVAPMRSILSGRPSTATFASGTIVGTPVSGPGPVYHIVRCHTCDKFDMQQWVTVSTYSGHVATYCWDCAGYRYQSGGFLPVQMVYEEILRHGVSDVIGDDAPREVIADRYEELGLPLIAQYLRNPPAGPITSSR